MTNGVTHVVVQSLPPSSVTLSDWISLGTGLLAFLGFCLTCYVVWQNRKQFVLSTKVTYLTHLVSQDERALQRLAKYIHMFHSNCYDPSGFYIVPPDPRSLSQALERLEERQAVIQKTGEDPHDYASSPRPMPSDVLNNIPHMITHYRNLIEYRTELEDMSRQVRG